MKLISSLLVAGILTVSTAVVSKPLYMFITHASVGAASSVLYTTGSGQLSWISMSGIATNAFPNSDSLAEGSSNLYFTDERAQDTLGDAISSGIQTGIKVTYNDTANSISFDVGNQSPYPFTTKGFSMPI